MPDPKDRIALKDWIRTRGFDVGVVDSNQISEEDEGKVVPPDHDSGGVQEKSDLSAKTKMTIGAFLETETAKNRVAPYEIIARQSENTIVNEYNIPLINKGAPLEPGKFSTNPFGGSASSINGTNLLSSISENFDGTVSDSKNGFVALPSDPKISAHVNEVAKNYTSKILQKNRFRPSFDKGTTDKKYNAEIRAVDADTDTSYYTKSRTNSDKLDENSKVSFSNMSKVAKTLMLRATGEVGANKVGYDPEGAAETTGALLPGKAQILPSKIVEYNDLEARDVLYSLLNGKDELGSHSPGPSGSSWGVLNNHLERFSSIAPLGMMFTAAALIVAIGLLLEGIGALIALTAGSKDSKFYGMNTQSNPWQMAFGKYQRKDTGGDSLSSLTGGTLSSIGGISSLESLLGLADVGNFQYYLKVGLSVFFRGNSKSSLPAGLSPLLAAASQALDSPGFYAIFYRAIVRSGYTIGKNLADAFSGPTNLLTGIEGVLGIFNDLRESKIIAILNLIARVGYIERTANINELKVASNMQNAAQIIDRIDGHLRWSSDTACSILLYDLPNSAGATGKANYAFTTEEEKITEADDLKKGIPTRVLKDYARRLNSEYLPFYFVDTRTNELVAFHAFLKTLTDDYAPSWENIEAYGRVDAIRIYKNTARKLGISFVILATNEESFKSNWNRINKLVSLVYPQWSPGKQLQDIQYKGSTFKIRQPFSQTIAASPIVRLRIGDLIKTNYTEQALSQMFALTQTSAQADDDQKKLVEICEKNKESFDFLQSLHEKQSAYSQQSLGYKKSSVSNHFDQNTDGIYSSTGARQLQVDKLNQFISDGICRVGISKAKFGEIAESVSDIRTDNYATDTSAAYGYTYSDEFRKWVSHQGYVEISKITLPGKTWTDVSLNAAIKGFSGKIYANDDEQKSYGAKDNELRILPHNLVIIDKNLVKSKELLADKLLNTEKKDVISKKEQFIRENVVFKTFYDNTASEGLACTIDSMTFDWLGESPWELDEQVGKMPKMCTVNMSLTVIHDIAPGLTSDGTNRAPIYRLPENKE